MTATKIAVTVPRETFAAVERRRRVLGVSRSAVVTAALEAWLKEEALTPEERQYLVAYLREPESTAELRDAGAVAKAALSTWEPWDAGGTAAAPPRPRRASEHTSTKPARRGKRPAR